MGHQKLIPFENMRFVLIVLFLWVASSVEGIFEDPFNQDTFHQGIHHLDTFHGDVEKNSTEQRSLDRGQRKAVSGRTGRDVAGYEEFKGCYCGADPNDNLGVVDKKKAISECEAKGPKCGGYMLVEFGAGKGDDDQAYLCDKDTTWCKHDGADVFVKPSLDDKPSVKKDLSSNNGALPKCGLPC